MSTRPAQTQQCTGLGLARFQRHAAPTELPSEAYDFPVVRAFIQKQGYPLAYGCHRNGMRLKIVGKRLFHVRKMFPEGGFFVPDAVQNVGDVFGIGHGAIKVGGEEPDTCGQADGSDALETFEVPSGIVPAQFDFEREQAVACYPVDEGRGVAIVYVIGTGIFGSEGVESAHEVPGEQPCFGSRPEKVRGVKALKADVGRVCGGSEEVG